MSGSFDGTSALVADFPVQSIPYPFTLTAWMKTTGNPTASFLFGITDAGANGINNYFAIRQTGTFITATQNSGGTIQSATSTTFVNTGTAWFFVAAVFRSDADREIYVNGVSEAQNTTAQVANPALSRIAVGANQTLIQLEPYTGLVADPNLFSWGLSPDEVADLAAGSPPDQGRSFRWKLETGFQLNSDRGMSLTPGAGIPTIDPDQPYILDPSPLPLRIPPVLQGGFWYPYHRRRA